MYRLVIPVGKTVYDLSEIAQKAATNLGELRAVEEFELNPTDKLHAKLLKQIETDGAGIWKLEVRFEEIVG